MTLPPRALTSIGGHTKRCDDDWLTSIGKGPFIFVSGTTSLADTGREIQHLGDASKQTEMAFVEALKAVEALGGGKGDVCRVRMFVAVRGIQPHRWLRVVPFFMLRGIEVLADHVRTEW